MFATLKAIGDADKRREDAKTAARADLFNPAICPK